LAVALLGVLPSVQVGFAQETKPIINASLQGTVIDALTKEPLAGVTVQLDAVTHSVQTDREGSFQFVTGQKLPFKIKVSFVGYSSKELVVTTSPITIELEPANEELDEVVVVGYGTLRKRDLTGSVSSLRGEEVTAYPVPNIALGLQGKTAGVQVVQNSGAPGAGVSVRIRGGNSIQGNNDPLYIVDGFALEGSPNLLNPSEIETIDVLKDASSTAIYGARGANGVVIITTKQGKTGRSNITYDNYLSLQKITKKIEVLNAKEFALIANERAKNDDVPAYFTEEQIASFGEGFDWQDAVYRTAPLHNHAILANGGNESTQYAFSGNYLEQQGIIKNSNFNRLSLRSNVTQRLTDKIKVNVNLLFSNQKNNQISGDNGQKGNSVTSSALVAPPTLTPYNEDGSYTDLIAYQFSPNGIQNPIGLALSRVDLSNRKSIIANPSITYTPIKGLIFKSSFGVESNTGRSDNYSPTILLNTPTGSASISSAENLNFLNENTANFSRNIGRDRLDAVLGLTYQSNVSKSFSTGSVSGFTTDETGTNNLGAGSVSSIPSSSASKWSLLSYLARVNYALADKYLFTASIRADGSSRFGKQNKWGYFPSGAFAWRISQEDFFNVPYISDFKLRTSYGLTGSAAVSPYQTLSLLQSYSVVFDDELHVGYAPSMSQFANPNLKWESTAQFDLGLDLALIDNRVRFTFDYYNKNTFDLLQSIPLAPSLGYTGTISNIGKVNNKGVEFGLDATIIEGANWNWNINGNLSKNRNKVVSLVDGADLYGATVGQPLSAAVNLVRVGEPVGVFYTYIEDGLDEKGAIAYKDLDGDGEITVADKAIVGNPHPDFIYNFGSTLRYKHLQLDVAFQGRSGGDLFNHNLSSVGNSFNNGENLLKEVFYDHWTEENPNPNAKYPKISQSTVFQISDRYVEDASFLRLKNVQLAYTLNLKKSFLNSVQLFVSGTNLLTFTQYSWFDPEVSTRGGGISLGIDQSSYPNTKLYTAGVNVKF